MRQFSLIELQTMCVVFPVRTLTNWLRVMVEVEDAVVGSSSG